MVTKLCGYSGNTTAVERFDGVMDMDGDGKKKAVLEELAGAGLVFGKRQFNRAVEWALVIVERRA